MIQLDTTAATSAEDRKRSWSDVKCNKCVNSGVMGLTCELKRINIFCLGPYEGAEDSVNGCAQGWQKCRPRRLPGLRQRPEAQISPFQGVTHVSLGSSCGRCRVGAAAVEEPAGFGSEFGPVSDSAVHRKAALEVSVDQPVGVQRGAGRQKVQLDPCGMPGRPTSTDPTDAEGNCRPTRHSRRHPPSASRNADCCAPAY